MNKTPILTKKYFERLSLPVRDNVEAQPLQALLFLRY